MIKVIYKKTGEVTKDTKQFPAILFRSRERNRNVMIGNSPVEVSENEYEALKTSKHAKDIVKVTAKTVLTKPIVIDITGKKVIPKKKIEIKSNFRTAKKIVKRVITKSIYTKYYIDKKRRELVSADFRKWANKEFKVVARTEKSAYEQIIKLLKL